MKFDLSTILLAVVALIPGLFAQRSRNQLVPQSFAPQGASAELAELVALGVSTHAVIALLAAAVLALLGWAFQDDAYLYFTRLDSLIASPWFTKHPTEAVLLACIYLFVSLSVSHWLGLLYGYFRLNKPFITKLLANAAWLRTKAGIVGLLGERRSFGTFLVKGLKTQDPL